MGTTQSNNMNIEEVIQRTTSEVPLADLQKKGFKRVKVLDREAIQGMIREAVEAAVARSGRKITEEERVRIREESQREFDEQMKMLREGQEQERKMLQGAMTQREAILTEREQAIARERAEISRAQELFHELKLKESALQDLESKLRSQEQLLKEQGQQLESKLREIQSKEVELENRAQALESSSSENSKEALAEAVKTALKDMQQDAQPSSGDLGKLQKSIESLARGMRSGGGAAAIHDPDQTDEAAIEVLLKNAENASTGVESNLEKVVVKKSQAKGVGSSLEKLKNLKKGN